MAQLAAGAATEGRTGADRVLVGLRIGTALAILLLLWTDPPWRYGHLPASAMVSTTGRGLIDWLPTSSVAVGTGAAGLGVACVLVAVGRLVRPAALVAIFLGLWVLGVPQLFSPVDHYHHVLWLMVVVALSGGGTTRTRVDPEWWARAALLLIGLTYFFPGLEKALLLPEWVTTNNLLNTILTSRYEKGIAHGFVPSPWLAHGLAAALIAFELVFLVAAQTRLRRPAVVAACLFHVMAGLTAGIWFEPMLLVLWPFLLAAPRWPHVGRLPSPVQRWTAVVLVGLVVLAGATRALNAWPVAQYPAFAYIVREPALLAVYAIAEGERFAPGDVLLPHAPESRQRKFENSHSDEDLERALSDQLGVPVDVDRVVVRVPA